MSGFPILLDVDGVLLDWMSGFHHYRNSFVGSFADDYPLDDILNYARSVHYAVMGHVPGAVDGVAALRKAFPRSPIYAVTCCGRETQIVNARQNALRWFQLDGLIALDVRESKEATFKAFMPGVVIEDNATNLKIATDSGHLAMCFAQPWNVGASADARCTWTDMVSELEILL